MANPFDYEFIEPLTSSADIRGAAVFCRFVCPVTGRSVSASAQITALPRTPSGGQSDAGVLGGMRRSLAAVLQGVLGSTENAEARAEAMPDTSVDADEAARRRAIVRAFRSVSSLFRWDSSGHRWVAVEAGQDTLTAFERRLIVHPLRDTPDLDLLLRMLVALDRAEGEVGEAETAFLQPFAAASKKSLADILEQPAATPAELAAIAPSRREGALMVCWANALCDREITAAETALLTELAEALSISPERAAELKHDAQVYLLDKVLEEAFHDFSMTIDEEDHVLQVGHALGLSLAQMQAAIESFRVRRGLV